MEPGSMTAMKELQFIDMHCDTITHLKAVRGGLRDNDGQLSLSRMRQSGYLMQCFAIFINKAKEPSPKAACDHFIDEFYAQMAENRDWIRPVTTVREVRQNARQGLMSAMLTIEGGCVLEGRLENLRHFYDRGVRMLTLTWNWENELASPNDVYRRPARPDSEHGLKPFGSDVVKMMNDLGMIVDVSHLGDAGIRDVLRVSRKPIAASHSNARALTDVPRNLPDEFIAGIAANGGIIGLNYCPAFLCADGRIPTSADLAAHARHIAQVGGIAALGLGSDFDGIETTPRDVPDAGQLGHLDDALRQAGFAEADRALIYHDNFLRVKQANEEGTDAGTGDRL